MCAHMSACEHMSQKEELFGLTENMIIQKNRYVLFSFLILCDVINSDHSPSLASCRLPVSRHNLVPYIYYMFINVSFSSSPSYSVSDLSLSLSRTSYNCLPPLCHSLRASFALCIFRLVRSGSGAVLSWCVCLVVVVSLFVGFCSGGCAFLYATILAAWFRASYCRFFSVVCFLPFDSVSWFL